MIEHGKHGGCHQDSEVLVRFSDSALESASQKPDKYINTLVMSAPGFIGRFAPGTLDEYTGSHTVVLVESNLTAEFCKFMLENECVIEVVVLEKKEVGKRPLPMPAEVVCALDWLEKGCPAFPSAQATEAHAILLLLIKNLPDHLPQYNYGTPEWSAAGGWRLPNGK